MAARRSWIVVSVIAVFLGYLLWSTLAAQRVECDVCVEYEGRRNCASASADSEEEAARTAQSTACGPVAQGMNASIACGSRPPVTRQCRTR